MNNFLKIFLFSLGLALVACGKVTPPEIPPEQGKDYYPLKEIQRIYTVDTITFDLEGTNRVQDTTSGFIRHRMQWIDSSWVIENAFRKSDSATWEVRSYTSVIEQGREIIEMAGGAPLRKLIWPIDKGSSWEETALVPHDHTLIIEGEPVQPFSVPWNVTVEGILESHTLEGTDYAATLHKDMIEEDLLIEYRKANEIYALDIGLIYSYTAILDTQCEHKGSDISKCIDDAWADKANRGFIAELKLISWQ